MGDLQDNDVKKKASPWKIILPIIVVGAIIAGNIIAINIRKKASDDSSKAENSVSSTIGNGDNGTGEVTSGTGNDNSGSAENSDSSNSDDSDNSGNSGNSAGNGQSGNTTGTGNYSTYSVDGLSLSGDGYEGIAGTGNYNYGEALQKSILFYELQRSGALPDTTRSNWRGDSCLNDGQDAGLDLSGGWFDAGDNVKFNLPMAYTTAMLGWSLYEDFDAYEESGQLEYQLNNLRFVCDYFIKCHPEDEVYYYQVGDGGSDHSWWGAAELVETRMSRPSYCVTASNPGSCVTGETAAALAVASVVFKDIDPEYSALCLAHSESLYDFSEKYKSDAGYTAANGFYNSWSGFYDELAWAGAWLYIATGDESYLNKAEEYYPLANQDYDWAMCWDDVHIGAALVLAQITDKDIYKDAVENHLDWWTTGNGGNRITYTPDGLAWLDSWGSLRYATTTAFLAGVYSEWDGCADSKVQTYWDFAVSQADYALGSTGFSYMVGYGDSYPQHIHHRTAQGSYSNNMNEPSNARHILVGALVGGPDASGHYTDEVSNYNTNEVACDYNAGFTGLLAKLYTRYHGETIINLGAVEEPGDEFFAEASLNVDGNDFVEIRAFVYNETAWPARANKDLELRYFFDLSEVYEAGGTIDDIEITTNYVQALQSTEFFIWDEDSHIYYLSIKFTDGEVYPGGQEYYKKEVQVRMRGTKGVWDSSNDYSYSGLAQGNPVAAANMALYEGGELVYGSEPAAGSHMGASAGNISSSGNGNNSGSGNNNSTGNNNGSGNTGNGGTANSTPINSTAQQGDLSVTVDYSSTGSSVNSISGTINIKNTGSGVVSLKDLVIKYYFTNEDGKSLTFSCYYAGIQGTNYGAVNGCTGVYEDTTEHDSDTVCVISFTDNMGLSAGDTLSVNFCINHSDWSNMNMTNDYSAQSAANIEVTF